MNRKKNSILKKVKISEIEKKTYFNDYFFQDLEKNRQLRIFKSDPKVNCPFSHFFTLSTMCLQEVVTHFI